VSELLPLPLPDVLPHGEPLHLPRSVYLDAYLAPFRPWLERETVTEILVNRPGELWIEDAAKPGMEDWIVRLDVAPKT